MSSAMKLNGFIIYIVIILSIYAVSAKKVCGDGDVRAVNATKKFNGTSVSARVQYCVNGHWSDICYKDITNVVRWHSSDINVACKQLRNEHSVILESDAPITQYVIGVVGCFGYERKISECPFLIERSCVSRNAMVTDCITTASEECTNGDVKHANGSPIKVCEDGKWRYLCGTFWGDTQAAVVCKQNGRPAKGSKALQHPLPIGTTSLRLHYSCNGNERSLNECSRSIIYADVDCSVIAGADCNSNNLPASPEDFHITQPSSTTVQAFWTSLSSNVSRIFTFACNDSFNSQISITGSLLDSLDRPLHNATLSGLRTGELYRCCITVTITNGESSHPQCLNVFKKTVYISKATAVLPSTILPSAIYSSAILPTPNSNQFNAPTPIVWWGWFVIGIIVGITTTILVTVPGIILLKHRIQRKNSELGIPMINEYSNSGSCDLTRVSASGVIPDNIIPSDPKLNDKDKLVFVDTKELK